MCHCAMIHLEIASDTIPSTTDAQGMVQSTLGNAPNSTVANRAVKWQLKENGKQKEKRTNHKINTDSLVSE